MLNTGPVLPADGRTNAGCAGRARLEAGALLPGVVPSELHCVEVCLCLLDQL